MKQLIRISITAIALALAIVAHAQEKVSFSPEELELLRQLACEESDRLKQESSSPKTQALNSWDLSPSEMRSAYTEALQIQIESDLATETKVKEFCADD
jgi:hypothetical protein